MLQLLAALLFAVLTGHGARQGWRAYRGQQQHSRELQAVLRHYRLHHDGRIYDPVRNPELARLLRERDAK